MAKKPAQAAAVPAKGSAKTINRKSRNALERKSLPKAFKVQFSGFGKSTFKTVLKAWHESRKKQAAPAV